MKKLVFILSIATFTFFTQTIEAQKSKDIVDIAASMDDFSTLVAAVKAADLVDALKGNGPLTVFAPNNAAFNKLPKGTVETLLKPENKETLTAILTYHVLAGKYTAADIVKSIKANGGGFMARTLQGEAIYGELSGGNVILTDSKGKKSKVIVTDVMASNGVIHAIENVVMPK
ncbi:fasciclin domain-containing protein [uncultured Croceitalea sp.]|uniref:fasciclin domain-containing protein n=1 Tax=uncultured Croceitalea sp. TaxID=1798908 RepID=UPI0033059101